MKVAGTAGRVTEELPNTTYRVDFGGEHGEKICFLAGKMKLHKIQVRLGDRVEVVVDPYGGHATNRIIKRL